MSTRRATRKKRWSQRVTRQSNALDLQSGLFAQDDPKKIARSLARSAQRSKRRKSSPYRSATSLLTCYINRAGKRRPARRRRVLKSSKDESCAPSPIELHHGSAHEARLIPRDRSPVRR